jgi:hypothetical protein
MTYIWRGTLYDAPSKRRVIVYFSGWIAKGWPNLTTNLEEATLFLSAPQAKRLLRDAKKVIPWMDCFAVANHPALSENGD